MRKLRKSLFLLKDLNLLSRSSLKEKSSYNKTPVVKGTKKRKKINQHPTPSPTHVTHRSPVPNHNEHEDRENDQQIDAKENSDNEVVLTVEEIAELYEDKKPPEK